MIFVTIGANLAFPRLVSKVDEIAPNLGEEVIMQIGSTQFEPVNCEYHRFLTREAISEYYRNARLIVCHAGVGTIISAMQYQKPIILVPRRKKYGEVLDDHQIEIAQELERCNLTRTVNEVSELECAIRSYAYHGTFQTHRNALVGRLREYINTV